MQAPLTRSGVILWTVNEINLCSINHVKHSYYKPQTTQNYENNTNNIHVTTLTLPTVIHYQIT